MASSVDGHNTGVPSLLSAGPASGIGPPVRDNRGNVRPEKTDIGQHAVVERHHFSSSLSSGVLAQQVIYDLNGELADVPGHGVGDT
jgi:hypothetical protein